MKVLYDPIIYKLQANGGISRYFTELCMLNDKIDIDFSPNHILDNLSFIPPIFSLFRHPIIPQNTKYNIFHSSYYRTITDFSINQVLTIHDFAHERGYCGYFGKLKHALYLKRMAIHRSKKIICISKFAKKEFHYFYPDFPRDDVSVVYNGLSNIFTKLHTPYSAYDFPFVLFVGSRVSYKNFKLAVESVEKWGVGSLIIVGGGPLSTSELSLLNNLLTNNRFVHIRHVNDFQLAQLYAGATALLYLSSYEGFGIPVIEAFSQGCPVISINCDAIIEISSGLVLVAQPNPNSISDLIDYCLSSSFEISRNTLVSHANSFSWDKTRLDTLRVYEACL